MTETAESLSQNLGHKFLPRGGKLFFFCRLAARSCDNGSNKHKNTRSTIFSKRCEIGKNENHYKWSTFRLFESFKIKKKSSLFTNPCNQCNLALIFCSPPFFDTVKTTAPLQWSEVFVACHPGAWKGPRNLVISAFFWRVEPPKNKGQTGSRYIHICCQYVFFVQYTSFYMNDMNFEKIHVCHMFTNANITGTNCPASCKNLNPPNEDLDGNVAVATHDAIDGLQIRSGQFLSPFSKQKMHVLPRHRICLEK